MNPRDALTTHLDRRLSQIGVSALALTALVLLAAAPWQQDPPTLRSVLQERIGQQCLFTLKEGSSTLRFGDDYDGSTLTTVGQDHVQVRWDDGVLWHIPIGQLRVAVKP